MMGLAAAVHSILCIVAVGLSGYAYYVGYKKREDDSFEALCDISPDSSCSAVFTSRYGHGMGVVGPLLGDSHPLNFSSSLFGVFYFSILLVLGHVPSLHWLVLLLEFVSITFSIYLAYLLLYVLNDLCLLCASIHFINTVLLAIGLYQWSQYYTPHKTKHGKTD